MEQIAGEGASQADNGKVAETVGAHFMVVTFHVRTHQCKHAWT